MGRCTYYPGSLLGRHPSYTTVSCFVSSSHAWCGVLMTLGREMAATELFCSQKSVKIRRNEQMNKSLWGMRSLRGFPGH